MAFFRAGLSVAYEPIQAQPRIGRSDTDPIRNALNALTILLKIVTLSTPLKLFAPIAALCALLGLGYHASTDLTAAHTSLATIFLLSTAVILFLTGLVLEQINQLLYQDISVHDPADSPTKPHA
jgi:hypothetical protein